MRPILRGVKITTFLLGALLISTLIVIQDSRPTQAESLLNRVTCIVRGLLTVDCPTTPTTSPSQPTQPAQTTPTDTSMPPATSEPAAQATPVVAPQPLTVDSELLTKLPTISPVGAVTSQPANSLAYVFPNIRGGGNGRAVLGASVTSPIEATEQGWRILGVLWYWWLLAGIAGVATWKLFQQTHGVLRRGV